MATRHLVHDQIIKSFPADLPPAKMAPLLTALNTGVKLIDAIESQKAEMVKAGKLTPAGIAEVLTEHATQSIAGLREARHAALTAKEQATARRSKIKPEIKNPQDVAAVLDRQVIRRVVREAKDPSAILQRNDPRIMQAILTAPPVLSGIPDALHTQLLDQFATTNASADVSEINEIENAADAVLSALNEARGELQAVLGLDAVPFNRLASPIETETDAKLAPKPDQKPDPDALKSEFARLSHKERSSMIDNLFSMQFDSLGEKSAA